MSLDPSGRAKDFAKDIENGLRYSEEALAIDDRLEIAHMARGVILSMSGRENGALEALDTALALNPNHAGCHHGMAVVQLYRKEPDAQTVIYHGEAAQRLSPRDPIQHAFQFVIAIGHLLKEHDFTDPEYVKAAKRAAQYPDSDYYVMLLAAMAEIAANRRDAARECIVAAIKRRPDITLTRYRASFNNPIAKQLFEAINENGISEKLVELGLPRD